jgi:hypothetical protein
VCGDAFDQDPRDHEPGGKFASGIISKTYEQGQKIDITVTITANHFGYFEFRLCENNYINKTVSQECFDKNLLEVINNNQDTLSEEQLKILDSSLNKFKYFLPNRKTQNFTAKIKLPDYLTCKACILQWKYHSGNNYGKANNSNLLCLGCVERQEEFFNCADISILNSNGTIEEKDNVKETGLIYEIIKIFKSSSSCKYESINSKFLYFYVFYILYKLKY